MSEIAKLINLCPTLSGLGPSDRDAVLRHAIVVEASPGTVLFDTGSACQALPLLLSGSIRVFKRAETGREISLYRVRQGELCIVTVSCLLGADAYPATGIVESAVSAIALPRPLFLSLTESHPPFRQAVFHLFAERLSGLMQLVEEVAFRKLDQRLAALLAARAPLITGSHQKLADELGSVREIVSRLLMQFEEQGWIRLGRERIEIPDVAALQAYAAQADRAH
jgi:CRP/FNR family transcriptional regulator